MTSCRGDSGQAMNVVAMAVGFFVWYTCSNWVSALSYDASFSHWWLNRSGAVVVATIVLCIVLWRVEIPDRAARVLDWAFAVCYAAAMLMLSAAGADEALLGMLVAALVLFAGAQVWMVARWGSRYGRSSTSDVAKALLLAIVLVAAAKAVTTFLPEPATMTCMLLLPFLSAGMLVFHRTNIGCEAPVDLWFTKRSLVPFSRIIVAMAVFFYIWSILNMALKQNTGHYSFGTAATPSFTLASQAILLVFCVSVYWWVFVRRGHMDITVVWRFAYVLMAFALFMLTVLGMAQLIQAFTGAAIVIAKMFLWLGLANVALHSAYKPFIVFCPGMLLYSIPDWLGRSTASFFGLTSFDSVLVSALLVVSVVMVAFFLPSRSPDVQLLLSDLNGTERPSGPEVDVIDGRCAAVGEQRGLSKREIEIMQYLCKGRSRPYIAETLYLSENTVRTHSRRIHAKLDIHNRQELLDLVSGDR